MSFFYNKKIKKKNQNQMKKEFWFKNFNHNFFKKFTHVGCVFI